jgi:hypothetical protein
MHFLSNKEKEK